MKGITAIILAAGKSRRMGQPKMLLPWGERTVLEQVIATFSDAGITDILVVTGGARQQVETLVRDSASTVFNPNYETGEMLSSIQCGLSALGPEPCAVLIGLGDQPQVQKKTVQAVCAAYIQTHSPLVIPSYHMRRGHPWLADRSIWPDLLTLLSDQTPRVFLNAHADLIHYVTVETSSIIQDLDTPEDYLKSRP